MSILIHGLDFPKQDEYTHIRIYGNGNVTIEMQDGEETVAQAIDIPEGQLFGVRDCVLYTVRNTATNNESAVRKILL